MFTKDFHDRAITDIETASLLLSEKVNPTHDEGFYDIAAYHVQQGIEKELKHILGDIADESKESKRFRTHDIDNLIDYVEEVTDFRVSYNLKTMADTITSWEASSRYGESVVAFSGEIFDAINLFKELVYDVKIWNKEIEYDDFEDDPEIDDDYCR